MTLYKVTITAINPDDETKDIEATYKIESDNKELAIEQAKAQLHLEQPEIPIAKMFFHSLYETHEEA